MKPGDAVEFRYALRAHGGYDPAAASRLAIGLSQPLMSSVASASRPLSERPDRVAHILHYLIAPERQPRWQQD